MIEEKENKNVSKKLFVGGLSWNTTDESLRLAFERFGTVTDSKVITDRDTGRSRGFGFVTFENASDADLAASELDGADIDGRQVRVNEAQERQRGGGGGGGYRGGGGGRGYDRDDRGGRGGRW